MRAFYTKRFFEHRASAPPRIQRAVDRRITLLVQNLRHPSLRAKKCDRVRDIWQARANVGWRFCFTIEPYAYRICATHKAARTCPDPAIIQYEIRRQEHMPGALR